MYQVLCRVWGFSEGQQTRVGLEVSEEDHQGPGLHDLQEEA